MLSRERRPPRAASIIFGAALALGLVSHPCAAQVRRTKTDAEVRHLMGKTIVYPKVPGLTTPDYLRLESRWQSGVLCGPNAIYLLLGMTGHRVAYEDAVRAVPTDDRGSNMLDLKSAARRFGLECEVRRITPGDLWRMRGPVVIHMKNSSNNKDGKNDHFMIFCRDFGDSVEVVDTTNGIPMNVPKGTIARNFSGYCLAPIPSLWDYTRTINPYALATAVLTTPLSVRVLISRRRRRRASAVTGFGVE